MERYVIWISKKRHCLYFKYHCDMERREFDAEDEMWNHIFCLLHQGYLVG